MVLARPGIKDRGPVVQEVQTGTRAVSGQEGRGLLDRGGDQVEAIFIDLAEFEMNS